MKKTIIAITLITSLLFTQFNITAEIETTKEIEVSKTVTVKDTQVTDSEGNVLSEEKGEIPHTMIYTDNTYKGILRKSSETLIDESFVVVDGGIEYYRDYTVIYSGTVQLQKSVFFPDLAISHWAYNNIYLLAENGVINGFPDGSFGADKTLTIEQFVKMVTLQLGETVREQRTGETWSAPYFEKLVELGILKAVGSFYGKEVTDTITRLEMTYIISQVERYLTDNNVQFDGTTSKILSSISDEGKLEDWQKGHLATAYGIGVLTGYPDGTFKPSANLTRAEACTVVRRLTENDQRKPFDPSIYSEAPDLVTYATNDTMSVQRIDEDTIHVYRGKSEYNEDKTEWNRLYVGKNYEDPEVINAPVIGGVKQIEMLEFVQKYANWIETKYNFDGIFESHFAETVTNEQVMNHTNGIVMEPSVVDHPDNQNSDDYSIISGYYANYYDITRLATRVSSYIGTIEIKTNNKLSTDKALYYNRYPGSLEAAYVVNLHYKSTYQDTPLIQKDFEYAFELLFESDYSKFMNIWEDHMAGINNESVETYTLNGRVVRVSSDAVGITLHVSLKDFNW